MGWTSYHAKYYKPNGTVDRKKECDNLFAEGYEVIKSTMIGSTYYAAVKEGNDIFGYVMLTVGKDRNDPYFNFGYKGICETSGPTESHCPKSILELLTQTESEWANEWRKRCRENLTKEKLKDLPVGTIIYFKNWNEDEYILEKMEPNHQFKRTWWYNAKNNTYMPSRRIPSSWEIVNKGEQK